MKRWIAGVCVVDLTLLLWTVKVRVFCSEWLSCSARKLERGIIVAYFVCSTFPTGHIHSFGLRSTAVICDVFVCGGMWFEHCRSSQMRMYKCCDLSWIFLRTFFVICAVIIGLNILLTPPHRWLDALDASQMLWYAALHYSTSLPEDDSKRGRKRKLAKQKLREMFGSWLPLPEPSAA